MLLPRQPTQAAGGVTALFKALLDATLVFYLVELSHLLLCCYFGLRPPPLNSRTLNIAAGLFPSRSLIQKGGDPHRKGVGGSGILGLETVEEQKVS